ncbi:MAG: archaellin/type IV pilin N-terminal domain-containing protein, partial [Candidatus Hodarchaeales archaeon]
MRLFIYLTKKKRAISPVVSVILLIGLAVAAVAAIFLVVLPLFQATTDLEISDAFIEYDTDYTKTRDHGVGYGKGTIILTNAGTGSVEVVSIKIYYATPFTEIWNEISDAVSIQGITTSEPYVVNPLATNEELNIRFPIPAANFDDTVLYKIVITTSEDVMLDTSKIA